MDDGPLGELAARLRALRAGQRLSMGGLQQRSGLGRTTVSQALNGRQVPSEVTLVELAQALRTEAEPLLALRAEACRHGAEASVGDGRPTQPDAFDDRYRRYIAERHAHLEVVGLNLKRPGRARWPLDAAYLSLELAEASSRWQDAGDRVGATGPAVQRVERALAGCTRVLLKGLAGSGKTTLLQWLAVASARGELPGELADWQGRIPFLLPLRTLMRHGSRPLPAEFLAAVDNPLADAQPEGWTDRVLAGGGGLILIDGVDEVPRAHRRTARDWLAGLVAAYPLAYFVVTTRPSAVPEGWLDPLAFTELLVNPMNSADIGVFIGRWHAAARVDAESEAERAHLLDLESSLRATVRTQRDLAQLATTPLMSALICALHRERRGHLPHSRLELYEAALSMLLVRRDRERGITVPEGIDLTEHQSLKLLQRLAHWLILNQQTEMDRTTALALLEGALPSMPAVAQQGDAAEILTHLLGRSGLLRQPTADTIDFVHRTFQDYLGGKAAVESLDFPLLVNHAHDDQWEDVIRMAVAHARPSEGAELLSRLVDRGDREQWNRARLHLLAAASLHYAVEVNPETRRRVEGRAAALMPPRSEEEADSLAALGPGVLDLLPRRADGLADDEVSAVVRAAATIGGDQAYAVLHEFVASLPDSRGEAAARLELSRAWKNFDAVDFAREILFPQKIRDLVVSSADQLEALSLLTPVTGLTLDAAFTAEEIAAHTSPESTSVLRIYAGQKVADLRFVARLPALRELALSDCHLLTGIEDLAGLPISRLSLLNLPKEFSFDALDSMPALKELFLYTVLPWRDLTALEAPRGLTSMALGGWVSASVMGVSRWEHLRTLTVNHPLDTVEWEEVASLPRLTRLNLGAIHLEEAPRLTGIQHLAISSERSDLRIDLIPDRFPNLESLSLNCTRRWSPDITPLQQLENLKVSVHATGVIGASGFPPGAVGLYPRPRTSGTERSGATALGRQP